MDFEKTFERLFKTRNISRQLDQVGHAYLGALFDNESLTYETMITFINEHKKELIESALNDEKLIDNILCEELTVDRTKKHLITEEYLEDLINKINNKNFEPKAILFYLYMMQIYNLFGNKYDSNTLREILNLNLIHILENYRILHEDGDTILNNSEKRKLTDILLAWNKKCGKEILPYIFQLENLKKYITILLNSDQVKNNQDYQNRLTFLLKICEYSIVVRDTDQVPTPEEVKQINSLFSTYDFINKSIALDTLNTGNIMLVHFIRDTEVNYQIVGNNIIDISNKNSDTFDTRQSDFFIKSFCEHVTAIIEKQTGKKFDIEDPEMRRMLNEQIIIFNNTFNYRPLDRLPIKKNETGYDLKTYIRETDSRISCSFILNLKDKQSTHLDRKIGLIIRPTLEAILSTSLGYTSEKNFYDFRMDSFPCTEIFSQLGTDHSVNETCIDASKCEVIGVLLLSDEPEVIERAQKIAASYNTTIVRLKDEKNDAQIIKH